MASPLTLINHRRLVTEALIATLDAPPLTFEDIRKVPRGEERGSSEGRAVLEDGRVLPHDGPVAEGDEHAGVVEGREGLDLVASPVLGGAGAEDLVLGADLAGETGALEALDRLRSKVPVIDDALSRRSLLSPRHFFAAKEAKAVETPADGLKRDEEEKDCCDCDSSPRR